ncbi:hypothetical protein AGMMS50225_27810 [Betaproteobacteria bacterium]|nr:hypothetical protein AGMMS50225_27810 [Betaproteobacteria bacterium]
MTSAILKGEDIQLTLSKSEALVLFEWLSRNWEKMHWEDDKLFVDPAEKQLMIWLEGDVSRLLTEPFDSKYREILSKAYRDLVPVPEEWT